MNHYLRRTRARSEMIKKIEDGAKILGVPIEMDIDTIELARLRFLWVHIQVGLAHKKESEGKNRDEADKNTQLQVPRT